MDLKNRIEVSNCLIVNEQSNVESLGEEFCDSCNEENFVLKNACFYSIFFFF